jgi:hypothetical protein
MFCVDLRTLRVWPSEFISQSQKWLHWLLEPAASVQPVHWKREREREKEREKERERTVFR